MAGQSGTVQVESGESANRFQRHGFWRIPPGGRNLIYTDGYADGTPILLAADTTWALPWRATWE